MSALYHPFDTDHLYELTEDGNVKVTTPDKFGIFTGEGRHISGELRQADPQVCVWVTNNPDASTQLSSPRVAGREL